MIIKKSKEFLRHKTKRRLFENFISLSVLQVANYILPFVTLPYLVRVLGTEKFGLISFAQAFIQYFNILTDYGFNLSATREISIHRENREKVSEIFSSVMIIKFGLLIISFIILSIVVFIFKKFHQDWKLYYLTFGMVIGQVLFPVWFFQGMEKMRYITILNIVSKSIFTISIFIFVRNISDYIYVPILNSLGFLIAGLISIIIVLKKNKIIFFIPSKKIIVNTLKNSYPIFVSQISMNLYRNTNAFVLGLITNNQIVGYYTIAEKLLKAIQRLQQPVGQTLFPFLSKKYTILSNKEKINLIFKYFKYIALFYLFLIIILFSCSNFVIKLIIGYKQENVLMNFKILIPVVLFGGLNYYLGILGFVALGYKNLFAYIVTLVGILNLLLVFILSYFFKDKGASFSLLISELILTIIFLIKFYFFKKRFRYE